MTEIQQNRWDQLVRRAANIVAPGSMVSDSLNELFPFIDVETLNLELQYLGTWRPAFGSHGFAASVGNLNHAQLFNPADSGMIVVPTRVDINVAAIMTFRYIMQVGPILTSAIVGQVRDTRTGIADRPVGQIRFEQKAGGLAAVGQVLVRANVTFTFEDPRGLFVLIPGTGVTFATTTTNVASGLNFWWKERVAEPAELNF